jgi:hypothetical protein
MEQSRYDAILRQLGYWQCQRNNNQKDRITANGLNRGKWQRVCGGSPHHNCMFIFSKERPSRVINLKSLKKLSLLQKADKQN